MALRVIKLILSIIYCFFIKPLHWFFSKNKNQSCIILCYHSIKENELPKIIKQLDYLVKKTTPISLDFIGPFKKNVRYSILTFDDAFQSLIDRGVPELLKRKIPFAIFVPTGCFGKQPVWLENTDDRDKTEIVATKDLLLHIPKEYVIFGSHTISHPVLPQLNEEEAYREIKDSKNQLESIFQNEIKYLAFPHGEYNNKILELCKKAGYKNVFTINYEPIFSSINNFDKGRIVINPSDWMIEFILKLSGNYAWMPWASALKRKIKNIF